MYRRSTLLAIVVIGFLALAAHAGSKFINYQAVLADENGPLNQQTIDVTVKLYDSETAVDPMWWQTFVGVRTSKQGKIDLKLGRDKEIPDSAFGKAELWMGITIGGDDEMTPRTEIGAVPFALQARTVPDKAIGKAQLDTLSVDSSKIADKAIRKENIQDKAIGKAQLDTLSVDSSKIAEKAIRKENIQDKAIGKAQLDTLSVDSSKIANKAIRRENIKDKAIGKAQLDTLSVDSSKIADKGIRLNNIAKGNALNGQVLKWNDAKVSWSPAADEVGSGGGDTYWTLLNGALFTSGEYGIARGGNTLYGLMWQTHVNLGVACTTGNVMTEYIYCTSSGGYQNASSNRSSTVGGGELNRADGKYATVPGGLSNHAMGNNTFAAGTLAQARHTGSIVIAANNGLNSGGVFMPSDSVWTNNGEQMVLRADSGFYLTDKSDAGPYGAFLNTSTGAYLTKTGLWQDASDENKKENFVALEGKEILEKIATLPITRWNYKIDTDGITHIGPTAQDFHAVFGLGYDDVSIATIDEAGIALAAIQELHKKTQKIDELEAKVAQLEELVKKLVAQDK